MSKKRKLNNHRAHSINKGLAPGTMVFIGEQKLESVCIDIIHYSKSSLHESHNVSVAQCHDYRKESGVLWVNVSAVHDIALIEELGKCFDLHPLTLEDIVNTCQRPKTEEFSNYLFVVLKMITANSALNKVEIENVSLILGENFVLSFLEDEGDVFDAVRERIRAENNRIRSMKADYLAYALIDSVIDNYFTTVEYLGEIIEDIDDEIFANPNPKDIQKVHKLKRDILILRKAVWPLREEIDVLTKRDSHLVTKETMIFLRDLYDHTIQVIEIVESFRDILSSIHDTYLSSISNRMNEVMKLLTIISTIFIPLTFIVGVYGMNFEYMPELKWHFGYYIIWGTMLTVSIFMIIYFKLKKWI